jgi:uncharacterized protein YegP (UPF0339 family)
MAAKFEISKDKSGKFRFHLKAANGAIIATSQSYVSKESAQKGIEAFKANAPVAKVVDLTEQEGMQAGYRVGRSGGRNISGDEIRGEEIPSGTASDVRKGRKGLPQLTDEQRAAALQMAGAARRARGAGLADRLKPGGASVGQADPKLGPGIGPGGGAGPPSPRPRYLQAVMPDRAETGRSLSLIVAITLAPPSDGSRSGQPIDLVVPAEGVTVTIVVTAPGLIPRGNEGMEQDIHVPAGADSERRRFAFTAGPVGLHTVTVDAYRGGTHLGSVLLEVSVEANCATVSEGRERIAKLSSVAFEPGEVTLQVRRELDGAYRFQLLGDTLYPDVTAMMGNAGSAVEKLVADVNLMAAAKSPYKTAKQVQKRLKNLGIGLWAAAVPQAIQDQFWDQAGRIKMFTIAADRDTIPWELIYPMNGANDNGFLAGQFPVVRRAYAARRVTTFPIKSAAYIVPPGAPSNAVDEVVAIRAQLGPQIKYRGQVSELATVQDFMLAQTPSILHFACHNTFRNNGSSISLTGGPWTPEDLNQAVQQTTLAAETPLVFFNACRSAGDVEWFSEMSGWATKFMGAGAGAFIGSLWAIRSSAAKTFAEEFYKQFVDERESLGKASWLARNAISADSGDPTWLAYSVYGNPAAVMTK